jgi:hypothetical protein
MSKAAVVDRGSFSFCAGGVSDSSDTSAGEKEVLRFTCLRWVRTSEYLALQDAFRQYTSSMSCFGACLAFEEDVFFKLGKVWLPDISVLRLLLFRVFLIGFFLSLRLFGLPLQAHPPLVFLSMPR